MRAATTAMLGAWAAGAAGCLEFPQDVDPSWLTELQIVAIEVDPPQVAPSWPVTLTVTAVDPRHRGVEMLVWSCTDLGVGCLEQTNADGSPRPLHEWARVGTLVDDTFTFTVQPPQLPDPEELGIDSDEVAVLVWAVACAPGTCEAVERVRAAPVPGSEAWDRAVRMLAYPREWIGDLSPGWSSTAVKIVPVRSVLDNENPRVTAVRDALTIDLSERSGALRLNIEDDDSIQSSGAISAFSTFGPVDADLVGPYEAEIRWTAPPAVGQGRVYAVVQDGRGGLTVWRGEVAVESPR